MARARLVISPTMPRLALTDVLSAMAKGGHPVTPALVACLSPCIREHIRRFGRFVLDMTDLPDPLDPQPLPFEIVLWPLFTLPEPTPSGLNLATTAIIYRNSN
jgi:hypothetical protein